MRRFTRAALLAVAATSVTFTTDLPRADAAPGITKVAGPTAWFRSTSADGVMVIVHDGTQDLLIDRRTDGPPIPLPFRGGILTPDGTRILHSGPAPSPIAADVAAEPPPDVLRYEIATGVDTVLTSGLSNDWAYAPASSDWDGSVVGIQAKSAPLDDAQVLILDTVSGAVVAPDRLLPEGRSWGLTLSHRATRAAFSWTDAAGTAMHLYVYDAGTNTNALVNGTPADVVSTRPHRGASISGDGTHVVYVSDAVDVAAADPPPETEAEVEGASAPTPVDRVLLYDIDDEHTVAVARTNVSGVPGTDDTPSVNADGTRVAFLRLAATASTDGAVARAPQLFVRDLELGTTRQISIGAGGALPNGRVTAGRLAADGLTAFWDSTATNHVEAPSPTSAAAAAPTVVGPAVFAAALPALASCTITGTNGSDTLVGTAGDDVICGLGGNDSIRGLSGDDVIRGGAGDDKMSGGPGNDRIHGGDGNDRADGGPGDDAVLGGAGRDVVEGGSGDDRVFGGRGNDRVTGGNGSDGVDAGSGDDVADGGNGDDTVYGRAGRDTLRGGNGVDALFGGDGDDRVSGGNGHDRLHGNAGADVLEGNNGNDHIFGDEGRDRLYGNNGNDDLDGGAAVDLCRLGPGPGTLVNCEV